MSYNTHDYELVGTIITMDLLVSERFTRRGTTIKWVSGLRGRESVINGSILVSMRELTKSSNIFGETSSKQCLRHQL